MIEECYGEEIQIGFIKTDIVTAMKTLDPVAWELAKNEYIDNQLNEKTIIEVEGKCYYKESLVGLLY